MKKMMVAVICVGVMGLAGGSELAVAQPTAKMSRAEYCANIPKNPKQRSKEQEEVIGRGVCMMIFKPSPKPNPADYKDRI